MTTLLTPMHCLLMQLPSQYYSCMWGSECS